MKTDTLRIMWKTIPGFSNYEASSDGQIRSRGRDVHYSDGRNGRVQERILKQSIQTHRTGFQRYQVNISDDTGRFRPRRVHQLVALAFLGPSEGRETRHINGDSLDNEAGNLRYGTRLENTRDAITHGTHHNANKTHCKWGHEFTSENTGITQATGYRWCKACRKIRQSR